MVLLFAHVCESAFVSEGSKSLNIIGIFDKIGAQRFPAVHPKFSVVTAIQGAVGTYEQIITITNQETGQEVSRVVGQSVISVLNGRAVFMANFIMVTFPVPGKYSANIF